MIKDFKKITKYYSNIYQKIAKLREHRFTYDFILTKAENKYITEFSK